MEDFEVINFSEIFKSTKGRSYSKLNEEQYLRKVAKSLYTFLRTREEVEKYAKIMQLNFSDNFVHYYILPFFESVWFRTKTD